MPIYTYTLEERDKAARFLKLLVRWANWEELQTLLEPKSLDEQCALTEHGRRQLRLAGIEERDVLTEKERRKREELGKKGEKWTLLWKTEESCKFKLEVEASPNAFEALCSVSPEGQLSKGDIQTIRNQYFSAAAKNVFLGILTQKQIRKTTFDGREVNFNRPSFALALWDRKVTINEREMNRLWCQRYREVKGKELPGCKEFSSMQHEREQDAATAQEVPDGSQTVDEMPMPENDESQITPMMPMSFPTSPELDKLGEYGWLRLYEDLLEVFDTADDFNKMLRLYVLDHPESPESVAALTRDHDVRVLEAVTKFNREGRIVVLVSGAVQAKRQSPAMQHWRDWLRRLEDGMV